MSKVTKFRLWDGERMREVNTVGWVDGELDWVDTPKYHGPLDEDMKLVEYTGMNDKNNVEIYEGDIVEAYFWNDKLKPVKEKGFIEFQSGSFIFNFGNGTWEYLDGNEAALIVGNIYENADLMEDTK